MVKQSWNILPQLFHANITNFLVRIRRVSRVHCGHVVHLRISRQGQWWNPETPTPHHTTFMYMTVVILLQLYHG